MNSPASQALGVNRPSALGDEVYDAILNRITSLHIPPGARISVDQLARDLGVSQTPIRDALGRLETEGLVLKTHFVGFHAAPQFSRSQVEDLFELRLLIEPTGAARAAARLTAADADALGSLHAEMERLLGADRPAYGDFARKDGQLHAAIATASGSALLAETLERLHAHVHIFRLVFHGRVTSEAIQEHQALLECILKGDAAGSEAAMRDHVAASRRRILSLMQS